MKRFSERLMDSMREKEMSASELSRISGVGKADISNYLNNKYCPKQDKVYLIAKALDVNPGWLMTGVEQTVEKEVVREVIVPNTELFTKLLMNMSSEEYMTIMGILEKTEQKMKDNGEL